jgi:hypothetical protein
MSGNALQIDPERIVGHPEMIQRDLFHHLPGTLALAFRPKPIRQVLRAVARAPGFNFRMSVIRTGILGREV